MHHSSSRRSLTGAFAAPVLLTLLSAPLSAQGSLREVDVPLPSNLDQYVRDRAAAIRLGKALFWDQQVGSDGQTACATCHFHAGVDNRTRNVVHPGPNGVFDSNVLPGQTITAADFPLAGDDVVGSSGVVRADFLGLDPSSPLAVELCRFVDDGVFFPERQVTGRNSPSAIGAIFYENNFWDGRAEPVFNGVNGEGEERRRRAKILVDDGAGLRNESVRLEPASVASQSIGPTLSDVEMSCAGREFAEIGRKLLGRVPLALQVVAPDDSSLGALSNAPMNGLDTTYADLIRAAFHPRYYSSSQTTREGFTQMEANFTLFWGLGNLLYSSTLIPDHTRYDDYEEGNRRALTRSERRGLEVFEGEGRCDQCHGGAEFSAASIQNGNNGRQFANIGITDERIDPGRGEGEFKSQTLRNIELTGPYFHTGKYLTLRQVVDFYDRGGDFRRNDNIDSQVRRLGLSEGQKNDLVAFMLTLTDERLRHEAAPFDHPSLELPNGQNLPAVGRGGHAETLRPYLDANPFAR